MDACSVFGSSSTRRGLSRLDEDLRTVRRHSSSSSSTNLEGRKSQSGGSPAGRQPHIGIIGAGLSGLRCADVLLQHGFQVTVLEGRHRLGGRLHQERLPNNHLVDMGPNWIHGTKDNPIMDLIQETQQPVATGRSKSGADPATADASGAAGAAGVAEAPTPASGNAKRIDSGPHAHSPSGAAIFDEHGMLLPPDESDSISTDMWSIVDVAFVHSHTNCADIDPAESLYDYFLRRLPDTAAGKGHGPGNGISKGKTGNIETALHRRRVLQMADSWGNFVGSPITQQSLKYFWLEECIEGENLFVAGTYKRILEQIAEPAVQGAAILYGKTVARIIGRDPADTGNNDGTSIRGSDQEVKVTTACGETFSFDEVVCTAPLGWLKQHHADVFDPPLPPRLCQAIASIGYGTLEKVYISFPQPFWQQPDEATGRTLCGGFFHWLAPGEYAHPSNPNHWPHEAVDLSSLPHGTAHATLLFYIFGEQSRHVTDSVAALAATHACSQDRQKDGGEDKREGRQEARQTSKQMPADAKATTTAAASSFLSDYFRPYYSCLPHYDAAASVCQPTACLSTGWRLDDLAGNGSYSNFQVGLAAGDEDIRAMREGMPDRGVWLAGEHTAPFVALGTATGAYWSGEAVARSIAEARVGE